MHKKYPRAARKLPLIVPATQIGVAGYLVGKHAYKIKRLKN
jgi:hypothetical protein